MLPVRKSRNWSIRQQKLIGDLPVGRKVLEDHIAAIQRYAKALVDTIVATDYDGLDIDWEPDNGGDGGRYVGSLKDRRGGPRGEFLHYLVEEIGKILLVRWQPSVRMVSITIL